MPVTTSITLCIMVFGKKKVLLVKGGEKGGV